MVSLNLFITILLTGCSASYRAYLFCFSATVMAESPLIQQGAYITGWQEQVAAAVNVLLLFFLLSITIPFFMHET